MESILIIEDEAAVAKGLIYGLRERGYEVDWADSGRKGLVKINEKPPRILILDIRLPDIDGNEVCRELRKAGHTFPVLMLTANDAEVDKVLGLELGADDYMVKPYSFRELLSRIHALLRRAYGQFAVSSDGPVYRCGSIEIHTDSIRVFKGKDEIYLTPIEYKLLKFLAEHPGRVFSRVMLISQVWGENIFADERTVDVHIRRLREKIEDDPSNPVLIETVRGTGYKFGGDIAKLS